MYEDEDEDEDEDEEDDDKWPPLQSSVIHRLSVTYYHVITLILSASILLLRKQGIFFLKKTRRTLCLSAISIES